MSWLRGLDWSTTCDSSPRAKKYSMLLATVWLSRQLPYLSAALGAVALLQWMTISAGPFEALPVVFARLALVYGMAGFGLALPLACRLGDPGKVWALPLQHTGLTLSAGVLMVTVWRGNNLGTWWSGWTERNGSPVHSSCRKSGRWRLGQGSNRPRCI